MDVHNWLPYVIGGLAVWVTFYYAYINRRAHELEDKDALWYFREQLEDSRWALRYRITLARGLERAEAFFGKPFSWRALNTCWLIAFVYPLILFLLTWVFGGPNTLGVFEVLPSDWSFVQRMAFLLILIGYYFGIYWLIRKREQLDVWIECFLDWGFSKHRRLQSVSRQGRRLVASISIGLISGMIVYVVIGDFAFSGVITVIGVFSGVITVAVVFAIAGAFSGTFTVAFNVAFAIAIAFVIAGAFAIAFAFAIVGIFAVAGVFSGIFAVARTFAFSGAIAVAITFAIAITAYLIGGWTVVFEAETISLIVFVFLLPLLNGLLDYVSWAVSRTMGRFLLKHGRYTGLLLAFADFILALGLLIALAWGLCLAVEGINQLALAKTGTVALDLEGMLSQAAAEPFGAGFWITAMLFSTLVPTILHLLFAVGSVVALHSKPGERKRWIEEIEAVEAGHKEQINRVHRRLIARYLLLHRWAGAVALSVGIVVAVGWGWSTFVYDLSDTLLAIATSARTFVGG